MYSSGTFAAPVQEKAVELIAQYGDDAEVIAMLKAAELAALGDADALAVWDDIIACIAALSGEQGARDRPS